MKKLINKLLDKLFPKCWIKCSRTNEIIKNKRIFILIYLWNNRKKKMTQYNMKHHVYVSFKDVSLGIMIFSNKEIVYGPKGRTIGIEINIMLFHFKIAIVRSGF